MSQDKYQIDMCHGPLLKKIILFALPLMSTYVLQLAFNAVDLIVVGRFADHKALAAIGATFNLNALIINLFIGFSVGGNVVAANRIGAKDMDGLNKAVHTSMAVGLWGGMGLTVLGLAVAKPLLQWMATPADILGQSCTYIWICFLSLPFIMLYNFGCAILRALGDTRRPLYFLVIAGIVNVVMNLIFVIGFKMDVAGVAVATALSHLISAFLVVRTLRQLPEEYRLKLSGFKIHWGSLREIISIGFPAGIQSSCFSTSNMLIQSSINSFGPAAMAGSAIVVALEGMVYVGSLAFHQTVISFVAQNAGGRKYKRIMHSVLWCYLCAFVTNLTVGMFFYLCGRPLVGLFNQDPEVIREGLIRVKIMFIPYFFCGLMDVASGALRGLGYSVISAGVCLMGACVFRIFWVLWILPLHRCMEMLLLSYPVSWLIVGVINSVIFLIVYRKLILTNCPRVVKWSKNGPGIPRGYRALGGSK